MDKQKQIKKTCKDCIHEWACQAWTRGTIHNMNANNCAIYETVKGSTAYYIGTLDGARMSMPSGFLEDLLIEFDEMSFFPATTTPNPDESAREWKRKLIYAIGQLRKETAEKFAERLKEYVIDEICKEITEGRNGN